jgi:hypothetical protein
MKIVNVHTLHWKVHTHLGVSSLEGTYLEHIHIQQYPDRRTGVVMVNFLRPCGSMPPTEETLVMLDNLISNLEGVVIHPTTTHAQFEFRLHSGQSFCETAMLIVWQIMEKLGIHDPELKFLRNFSLTSTPLVKTKKSGWLTFQESLTERFISCFPPQTQTA